jgi:hypothetical protein
MEVARGIFRNISKARGLLRIFVNCGLILDNNMGLFAKWHGIIGLELFYNGKRRGLGPRFVDHRRLAARVATRRGRGGMTGEPLTGAWTTVRQRRDDDSASARKGDGVGMAERRGQADGVGVFNRGGGSFYRARGGVLGR